MVLQYFTWIKSVQTNGVELEMQKFVMLPWHASRFMAMEEMNRMLLFKMWEGNSHEPYNFCGDLKEVHDNLEGEDQ
jgi:hypothetical protein